MLDRVKLTCFQQHRDLEVKLGPGLTAIRGANESGKSTLLRGICYALFGAKAMPDTLENLVTWEEDVKKLKSEVDFTVEGVTYSVKRGKSGAEVNYDGGRVTGQNEVTAFVCRLLRVDAGAAPRLMLSNQNEIRGALEAGPKETTALIERLSDFNQIDEIVDLIQKELVTGNVATAEAAVDAARAAVENARDAAVAPNVDALDEVIENRALTLDGLQGDFGDLQDAVEAAAGNLNDGKLAAAERQAVLDIMQQASNRMEQIDKELVPLREVKAPDNVEATITDLRAQISAEERRAELQARAERASEIWLEVSKLQEATAPTGDIELMRAQLVNHERGMEISGKWKAVVPFTAARPKTAETFKGTITELEAAITQRMESRTGHERAAAKARSDAALFEQQITDGSCGFCGQDFSQVEAVKVKNAELQKQIDALEVEARDRVERVEALTADIETLRRTKVATLPVLHQLAVVGADYAALADDLLPPVLKWVASPYSEELSDPEALRSQITAHEQQQRAYDRAQAKIEALVTERDGILASMPDQMAAPVDARALKRQIRELEDAQTAYTRAHARIEALQAEYGRLETQAAKADIALDDHPAVDLVSLQAVADAARAALAPAQQAVREAEAALTAARQAKVDAVAAYERARAALAGATKALEERQQELADLRFNNKLLKDVRAARPIISDKLWNMVLGAVSRYFSEMRGVESIVTKGQDGFMVDGHVVSPVTLSGSALDILGLAIRVALVKTFLPACPFFVLDEPAQGCDDNRTANLLSFLSACGFGQVLLVTHEDTSESVAQNMITIGA